MSALTEWDNGSIEPPAAAGPPKRWNIKSALSSERTKRFVDLCSALAILLFFLPVIAIVCVALYVTDGRPLFFSQMRVGRGGKLFRCYKFRTMVRNSEEAMRRHLEGDEAARLEWAECQKLRRDPRVHPLGAILRQSSLDELPQLVNVLKGEMSMVGPRPIVTDEIRRFGENFVFYSRVRPGLTGLWQISGRSETTYEERVELDTRYVLQRTLALDLKIMLKTAQVAWVGRGSF